MRDLKKINYINEYLKERFGKRTLKIGIDGNFTCPNRDGSKSYGGCIFCSERGSGEHLKKISIEEQLTNYFNSYKAERADNFIIYFQNFTNTYDTIENLKEKYDTALATANQLLLEKYPSKKIVGLAISTRPDCIDKKIVTLLSAYNRLLYTTVELGLQTANDDTKQALNLQYTNDDFKNAVQLLQNAKIDVVAHMMVGLPNETHKDIINTIDFLNHTKIQGLKIHSTYIVKNTILEQMYMEKNFFPISKDDYINEVLYIITHISPHTVIHRISGDAPKNLLVAPEWNLHKKQILNGVFNALEKDNLWQGMYFKNDLNPNHE